MNTQTVLRPAAERFHGRLDWLESRHTFSFGHHYDPAWVGYGPLLVINEDTIAPGRGFGMHPHRDMEIITVMLEGELTHRDSMGHGAALRVGEVQRMSAGTGVVHSEINETDRPCRLLQIWIEPASRGIEPAYEQKTFTVDDQWTLLLDPQQADGAMAIHRPVRLWRAKPGAGDSLDLPVVSGRHAWLQLIEGAVELSSSGQSQPLSSGDGLGFQAGGSDRLTARAAGTDLLLFELA
ncbi:pirin family protein [Synechococcus sp. CS-205]|jgi:redox-sensitive bicupin YhaK (pirin superfamily)|uniref:pirin family protein n=1 Tax=Synechococcus sp. CS-205 TaxID=2847984 RepID=UPI00223BF728|nr:pirin family protein [Synechococcus sp. CS-205]MCT0247486.1 pirin family protein [Synechococcus sp. CS-205]